MIKAIIGLLGIMALLSSSSCTRNAGDLQYWIFQDTLYGAATCAGSGATILSLTGGGTTAHPIINSLSVTFGTGLVPVNGGTYTVSDTAIGPTQVSIIMDLHYNSVTSAGGTTYISTGGNGQNQTVQVSTAGTGITVAGVKIMMRNIAPPHDSSTVSFNLSPSN